MMILGKDWKDSLVSVNDSVEFGQESEEASIVHLFWQLCFINISSLGGCLQGSVEPGEEKTSAN